MTPSKPDAIVILRGMAGAAIGAVLGWFAFGWLVSQGFYGLALPGALVGFGCGAISGGVSRANAILCAAIAGMLGIVLDWWHRPFVVDPSFGFFVSHLHALQAITWVMIALGMIFAFWFGRGRSRLYSRQSG